MSLIQFGCPLCGGISQIDGTMAGQETCCPGCGSTVRVPVLSSAADRLPPIVARAPGKADSPAGERPPPVIAPPRVVARGPGEHANSPEAPAVVVGPSRPATPPAEAPSSGARPAGQVEPLAPAAQPAARLVRRLSADERAARRLRRNIIMASLGLAILVIALAALLRWTR